MCHPCERQRSGKTTEDDTSDESLDSHGVVASLSLSVAADTCISTHHFDKQIQICGCRSPLSLTALYRSSKHNILTNPSPPQPIKPKIKKIQEKKTRGGGPPFTKSAALMTEDEYTSLDLLTKDRYLSAFIVQSCI
jgi:hypothetical protein